MPRSPWMGESGGSEIDTIKPPGKKMLQPIKSAHRLPTGATSGLFGRCFRHFLAGMYSHCLDPVFVRCNDFDGITLDF